MNGVIRNNGDAIIGGNTRPFRPKVCFVGTSLVNHGFIGNHSYARGFDTMAHAFAHRSFDYPRWYDKDDSSERGFNQGVSSQFTHEILSRFDNVINLNPDLVFIDSGTNDLGQAVDAADFAEIFASATNGKEEMALRLLDNGITPVINNIFARDISYWTVGSYARKLQQVINEWTYNFAAKNRGVEVYDPNNVWVDRGNANGEPLAGHSWDGTHLSNKGAFAVGRDVAKFLENFTRRFDGIFVPSQEGYSAENPYGTIAPNPNMLGTGGSSTTPCSGTVADGYQLLKSTGSTSYTAVGSKVARDDGTGGEMQRIVLTGTGSGDYADARLLTSPSTYSPPEAGYYRSVVQVDVTVDPAGGSRLTHVSPYIKDHKTGGRTSLGAYKYNSSGQPELENPADEDYSLTVETPIIYFDGTGNCQLGFYFGFFDDTAATIIDIKHLFVERVRDVNELYGAGIK